MILRVSPSTLSTKARCTTKAYLRASGYNGVTTSIADEWDKAPMEAGKAVHRALWARLSGKSDDEALKEIDPGYRAFGDALPSDKKYDRLRPLNVKRAMQAYFHQRSMDDLLFVALFPEREVHVPLDEAGMIILILRFDVAAVKMKSTDTLWIMEHKTTGTYLVGARGDTWFKQWRTDAQVSAQVYAARKLGIPAVGVLLNAIGLHNMPYSNKTCRDHGIAYSECWESHLQARMQPETRDEEQIENWRQNAIQLATALKQHLIAGREDPVEYARTLPQEGLFNGSCAYCGYFNFCHSGNRLNPQWLERDTNPEGVTRSGLAADMET